MMASHSGYEGGEASQEEMILKASLERQEGMNHECWRKGGFLEDIINILEERQSLQIIHYAGVWPHLGTCVDVEIGQRTSS